jgi:hypothetical protein
MKVVEGQLQWLQFVSDSSRMSNSTSSESLRQFVNVTANQQAFTPDVLPTSITVTPMIEASSGTIVNTLG